jgi:hypothetical protein
MFTFTINTTSFVYNDDDDNNNFLQFLISGKLIIAQRFKKQCSLLHEGSMSRPRELATGHFRYKFLPQRHTKVLNYVYLWQSPFPIPIHPKWFHCTRITHFYVQLSWPLFVKHINLLHLMSLIAKDQAPLYKSLSYSPSLTSVRYHPVHVNIQDYRSHMVYIRNFSSCTCQHTGL